jgi:hypothetical protein
MNEKLFEEHYELLLKILEDKVEKINKKEAEYKRQQLIKIYNSMKVENKIQNEFYSLSHEIRSFGFFFDNGIINISEDSKSKIGPDFTYKNNYKIECTICTEGNGKNKKAVKDSGFQTYNTTIDYNEKFRQISLRITNSIKNKKEQFDKYLKQNVISEKDCCIIFINMGPFSTEWFPGEYCSEATRFLVGRGFPQITFNKETGKQIGGMTYSFIPEIKNNNGASVNNNIFVDKDLSNISGIIMSTATLGEDYTYKNAILFLNPLAQNKIKVKDFKKFLYWKINNNFEYVPRVLGKRKKISEKKIW